MTKPRLHLLMLAIPILILAVGWGFNLYNTQQQEALRQANMSLNKGIAMFQAKKYTDSLAVLQSIPDGVIEDWHLPYYTASSMVMLKDYNGAVPELEEALVLNPQETLILFELGVVYFKLGNLAMSKAYFAAVVEIDPSNTEAKGLMDIMANLERQQPGDEK